jgi:hypothetical protein
MVTIAKVYVFSINVFIVVKQSDFSKRLDAKIACY